MLIFRRILCTYQVNDPQSNISDGGYLRKFLTIFRKKISIIHCVISARIQSYSGPHFPAFGLNSPNAGHCGPELLRIRTLFMQ